MQPINISMRYREFKYKFMDESYDIMEMPRKLNKDEVDQANTIDGIIKKIKGVKEIIVKGSQRSIMIDVPPKTKARAYRIEFMKNIANLLQTKHKIDAQYDSRGTTASTSGFVSVAGTNLKYYVKDGKVQGDNRLSLIHI